MSQVERAGYVKGMIDMLAYQTASAGQIDKAICIASTYSGAGEDEAFRRLYEGFAAFPDRMPEIVLAVLADEACGD